MALLDKLGLANGALIKLGEPAIDAISATSNIQASRLVAQRFTPSFQYVLRRLLWAMP